MTTTSWLVAVLSVLLFSVGIALCHSQHALRLSQAKEREAREGSDRLLRTIHQSRATLGRLSGECAALETALDAVMHSVVRIPLPNDLRSCYEQGVVYLPRTDYCGHGRARVGIPGMPLYDAFTIHRNPLEQTDEEREPIYRALRSGAEARAILGLVMS